MTNISKPMTFCQEIVLDIIKEFQEENFEYPTVREICKIYKASSPATIHKHLHNLEKEGYVEITGKKRGIKIK